MVPLFIFSLYCRHHNHLHHEKQTFFGFSFLYFAFSIKIYFYFRPWENDRIMNTDINAVTDLLQEKTIWRVVKPFIDEYNESMMKDKSQS